MKVIVINATGSQHLKAVLHVTSGVLEFEDGSISHVMAEKGLNKTIEKEKEIKKEEKIEVSSVKQSEPRPKPKSKQK